MPYPAPWRVVIIDMDGLRADAFEQALDRGRVPNLLRIVRAGGQPTAHPVRAFSVAPSITFAAQASIFTGAHPVQHRVAGNQVFDRFGLITQGVPSYLGFDVGDTMAYDDAVEVFRSGLADRFLNPNTPTIYESALAHQKISLVAYNMYGRGADRVIRPSLIDIARFTKGRGFFRLSDKAYDGKMLSALEKAIRLADPKPDLITAYFMGLDHHSHHHGPDSQVDYLEETLDPLIGRLLALLVHEAMFVGSLFVLVSDHGQTPTSGDDTHSIRLGFPFDMELAPLFHSLGLDVHDVPGEAPNVDAVVALNGGLAHVYLRHGQRDWYTMPRYQEDVLPIAEAFWQAGQTGQSCSDLRGVLDLILIRNVEGARSWEAPYEVYLGGGKIQTLDQWQAGHPEAGMIDAGSRIRLMSSTMSGDLVLAAKSAQGYYFGAPGLKGVHGSLHAADSACVLTFAVPSAAPVEVAELGEVIDRLIADRCAQEGGRMPSVADMAYVLRRIWLGEEGE